MKLLSALALLVLASGCAPTHLVVFDAWRGMDPQLAEGLKRGELPFDKGQVFDAANDVLENEPFFVWQVQSDPKAGTIDAVAGTGQEFKMSIADAAGDSASAHCKVSLEILSKPLEGQKDVWVSDSDSLRVSAYDLPFWQRHDWHNISARFKLDQDYLVSAIYRRLSDRSPVPFDLLDLTTGKGLNDGNTVVAPPAPPLSQGSGR
jgi:hypothetical protein